MWIFLILIYFSFTRVKFEYEKKITIGTRFFCFVYFYNYNGDNFYFLTYNIYVPGVYSKARARTQSTGLSKYSVHCPWPPTTGLK